MKTIRLFAKQIRRYDTLLLIQNNCYLQSAILWQGLKDFLQWSYRRTCGFNTKNTVVRQGVCPL